VKSHITSQTDKVLFYLADFGKIDAMEAMSGDYDHLLQTAMEYVEVE